MDILCTVIVILYLPIVVKNKHILLQSHKNKSLNKIVFASSDPFSNFSFFALVMLSGKLFHTVYGSLLTCLILTEPLGCRALPYRWVK